jgi:hypothetical protein
LESQLAAVEKHHKYGMGFTFFLGPDCDIEWARTFVTYELAFWQDCWKRGRASWLSDFSLQWRHDLNQWDVQIQYHGLLFPAIAFQIMLIIADADNLYCCSGCGTPYIRARDRKRPKRGCANYIIARNASKPV